MISDLLDNADIDIIADSKNLQVMPEEREEVETISGLKQYFQINRSCAQETMPENNFFEANNAMANLNK